MDNIPLILLMSLIFIAAGLLIYSFKSGSISSRQDGPPRGSSHIVVKTIRALDADGLEKTF